MCHGLGPPRQARPRPRRARGAGIAGDVSARSQWQIAYQHERRTDPRPGGQRGSATRGDIREPRASRRSLEARARRRRRRRENIRSDTHACAGTALSCRRSRWHGLLAAAGRCLLFRRRAGCGGSRILVRSGGNRENRIFFQIKICLSPSILMSQESRVRSFHVDVRRGWAPPGSLASRGLRVRRSSTSALRRPGHPDVMFALLAGLL